MAVLGSLRITTVTFAAIGLLASIAVGSSAMLLATANGLSAHLDYDTVNIVPSLQALDRIRGDVLEARLAVTKHGIADSDAELGR